MSSFEEVARAAGLGANRIAHLARMPTDDEAKAAGRDRDTVLAEMIKKREAQQPRNITSNRQYTVDALSPVVCGSMLTGCVWFQTGPAQPPAPRSHRASHCCTPAATPPASSRIWRCPAAR